MKLAFVTDIHNGKASLTKRGADALPLLEHFVDRMVTVAPAAVFDLGDRITDVDRDSDRATLAQLVGVFGQLQVPRYHLLGNHDCAYMSATDNTELLGQPFAHSSFDLDGWHIVLWQANSHIQWPDGLTASASDLQWLQAGSGSNSFTDGGV